MAFTVVCTTYGKPGWSVSIEKIIIFIFDNNNEKNKLLKYVFYLMVPNSRI